MKDSPKTAAIKKAVSKIPTFDKDYKEIQKVVETHRFIGARAEALEKKGFRVDVRPMGSGGVLQVKAVGGEVRVQIGAAWGKHNYALAVIL